MEHKIEDVDDGLSGLHVNGRNRRRTRGCLGGGESGPATLALPQALYAIYAATWPEDDAPKNDMIDSKYGGRGLKGDASP
jgi:hypothetical protein